MRSGHRTIVSTVLLYLSCSEDTNRQAYSFQLSKFTYSERFCSASSTARHGIIQSALVLPISTQRQGLERENWNLNPNVIHRYNYSRRFAEVHYSTTSTALFESKNQIIEEGKEKSQNKLLQDQKTDNPLATFFSSLPSIDLPQSLFGNESDEERRLKKRDLIKSLLRRLANLSLQDYYWRSDLFKKTEADRRVEESLARMMGEDAAYVRPMDAGDSKIGPLGRAEKQLVNWLYLVIEEEGRRARLIASSDGELVRPMDLQQTDKGGPLAAMENAAVNFLERIRESERERVRTMTLRPKDIEIEKRGPLGNFEARVVSALDEIRRSEELRMEQSRVRGGEIVRPIDVPGPLGEAERWYLELITAEQQRGKDRERNEGKLVRPKDASLEGPLGAAERKFSDAMNILRDEETERLKNIKRVLKENRPMEKNKNSFAGLTEAFIVGVFRAPQLLFRVIDRVNELMKSEKLNEEDQNILKKKK